MGSLDSIQVRQGLAQNVSVNVVDDAPVAIRLKYKGTGTITSVTVDTGTDLELITSDGGTETFAFATYSNLGLLVDKINASAYWEALLLDGLRTDETVNSDLVDGAKTITSAGFYDITVDTSTALDSANKHTFAYRCTIDRNPGSTKPKSGRRVRLSEVLYNLNVSAAEAKAFRIYEYDAVARTETIVYQKASVDATETTVNFASGNKTLDAGFGNDLIVKVVDGTSITDDAANFLNVSYTIE